MRICYKPIYTCLQSSSKINRYCRHILDFKEPAKNNANCVQIEFDPLLHYKIISGPQTETSLSNSFMFSCRMLLTGNYLTKFYRCKFCANKKPHSDGVGLTD